MVNELAGELEVNDERSGIHEIPDVSSTIGAGDARDLRWYFRTGGLDVFSGSTFGTQLEAASMYAHRIRRCPKCKGCGFAPRSGSSKRPTTAYERAWMAFKRRKVRLDLVVADEQCRKCLGMGYVVLQRRQSKRGDDRKITARPTGGSKRGKKGEASVSVSDGDLARLGRVTTRLERVFELAPLSVDVLEAYYGPDWDSRPDRGTPAETSDGGGRGGLFCVWPLTPAGKTLLKRIGSGGVLALHPLAALANEKNRERDKPNPNRRALLDACQQQAAELYDAACRDWNRAARAKVLP